MPQIAVFSLRMFGVIILLGFAGFGVISHFEKERRAALVSVAVAFMGGLLFWAAAALPQPVPVLVFWGLILFGVALLVLFYLPIGENPIGVDIPSVRVDERTIMFARDRLQPGSPEYQAYYEMHPDHEIEDNKTRAKPGLFSSESKFANPFQFAPEQGSFFMTDSLAEAVDGPVAPLVQTLPPDQMTAYIKDLAKFYGAVDVGVTLLEPYHVYSHIGRGPGTYGAPLPVEHKFAIAFTVEMDFEMVGTAPYPPTSMETGKQYVEAARVAVQLAAAIRILGVPARAHIDGSYRVIAPLVARDAGLGDIGRMTILMTPRQGPRVRLGVVTTDLELNPDPRMSNQALIDFCTICEKCAHVCPSRSIPLGPQQEIDGAMRWKLNPDTCFRYWAVAGTDCARCMAVCPYGHPDTFSHNFVRWGIARSGFFRRAALWMDDLFYGKKPKRRETPEWIDVP